MRPLFITGIAIADFDCRNDRLAQVTLPRGRVAIALGATTGGDA